MNRKQRPRARAILLVLLTTGISACEGMHGAPDGRDTPHATAVIDHAAPSAEDMASAVVDLGEPIGSVTLNHGSWVDDAAARRVTLLDRRLVADLFEDNGDEAVALLVANANGVDTLYAVVMDVRDARAHQVAATRIGTGVQLRDAVVEGKKIILNVARPVAGTETDTRESARLEVTLRDGSLVVAETPTPAAPH